MNDPKRGSLCGMERGWRSILMTQGFREISKFTFWPHEHDVLIPFLQIKIFIKVIFTSEYSY